MCTRRSSIHIVAALAATSLIAAAPRAAMAAGDPQEPGQSPAGQGVIVVEQVYNGPLFGAEFKFTEINNKDAYLFGGYAGVLFDNTFFVGAAGYWQMPDCHGYNNDYYGNGGCDYGAYYDYYGANGYGGMMLEWYALRSQVASVSARGLIGGGIANIGWEDAYLDDPRPRSRNTGGYPPGGFYYDSFDQGYFVFEPQINVTLRFVPGVALVGGGGYRLVGWANGWEDQLGGFTATIALRFGGR